MKRAVLSLVAVAAIGLSVAVAAGAAGVQRSDCPGKVVCPLTGDEVCKDQCPLQSAEIDAVQLERSCCQENR